MRRLLIAITSLLLLGCTAPQAATPTPTVAQTQVAVVEATATDAPLPTGTPTETPTETAVPTTDPDPCNVGAESRSLPHMQPPDLSKLEWERGTQGERRLTGMNRVPHELQLSPDGTQIAVRFNLGHDPGPVVATALLDTQGDEHRLLAERVEGHDRFYTWLPNGRLLWLDSDGQVWLDDVNLNAPVPMRSIEGLQFNVAYLQGKEWSDPDWRVSLGSRQWEEIVSADGQYPETLTGFSADGSYALYAGTRMPEPDIEIWRVPTGMGGQAQHLFSFEAYRIATDAYSGPTRAENLPGTGIWALHGPFAGFIEDGTNTFAYSSILLDLNAKKRLTAEDLGLDPNYLILSASIEDGQWLTVGLTKDLRHQENSTYAVIDTYYTSRYRLLGGTLSDEPPAVWINPLPEGATILASNVGTNWRDGSYTRDRTFVLVKLPGHEIVLERFDHLGQLIDALNLEREFAQGWWGSVFDEKRMTLYFSAAKASLDEDGNCQTEGMLLAWELVEALPRQ